MLDHARPRGPMRQGHARPRGPMRQGTRALNESRSPPKEPASQHDKEHENPLGPKLVSCHPQPGNDHTHPRSNIDDRFLYRRRGLGLERRVVFFFGGSSWRTQQCAAMIVQVNVSNDVVLQEVCV